MSQDANSISHAVELSCRDLTPPASVPGFRIRRRLGEGAYGSVWLATEQNTGKQVAIKFYSHRRGLDWSLLNREVEKLAVLYTSRNIVGLLDVGWDSDPPYYIMEHLENGSLAAVLAEGPLPPQEAVRITKSVLQALVHAHGSGILHCDLKPANVLLDVDYEPRLCDFGQSRLSDEQSPALGTMFYMAPEQADLTAVPDARWDVYALGALLYQMLTGKVPHRTPDNERRIRQAVTLNDKLAEYRRILTESPKPTAHRSVRGVDGRLAEIIDRCLRIDPNRRIRNAQVVLDMLRERDRIRARRPMQILAVAFPIILLILLWPVASKAGRDAVDTASANMTERALESDVLSANIMAQSLQRDLEDRRDELVQLAEDLNLSEALKENNRQVLSETSAKLEREGKGLAPAKRTTIWNRLKRETWEHTGPQGMQKGRKEIFVDLMLRKAKSDDRRIGLGRSLDRSWFVTDVLGFQRWRDPPDFERTLDIQFNYRDYFHGRNTEYPTGQTPPDLKPIESPHVSLPFRSVSTKKFMVAISVPIRGKAIDGKPGPVVGILARTMDLGELLRDYSTGLKRDGAGINRSFVLVENAGGKLLDHPWMDSHHLEELEKNDRDFKQLTLDESVRKQIAQLQSRLQAAQSRSGRAKHDATASGDLFVMNENYQDPIGRIEIASAGKYDGTWLAAFAPVGDTGWTVIVQERKKDALKPIKALDSGLFHSGLRALGLFLGLIFIVWAVVFWRLNDRSLRSFRRVNRPLRRGEIEPGSETPRSDR